MPYPSPDLYPSPTLFPGTSPNDAAGAPPPPRGLWDGDSGDLYTRAIRSGAALWYTVDAYRAGVLVADDLRPLGGSVTDTIKPGARRRLELNLAAEDGLDEELEPTGTELRVTAHLRYTDRTTLTTPMGWFDIDSLSKSEKDGSLSLTAPDRWVRIQRARFIRPRSTPRGRSVVSEITDLIRGALGSDTEVLDSSNSTARTAATTYDRDRDQAIITLAQSAGLWVFFDRDGVAQIVRQPTGSESPAWRADASESGVLVSLDRERSRTVTRNVVVVESSAADGAAFPTQTVWDNNPASPTYAGANPITDPGSAGPFGVVPYFFETPLPLSVAEARQTALTILARTTGLASQVSLEQGHNPRVDAADVITVTTPGRKAVAAVKVSDTSVGLGSAPFGEAPFGVGIPGEPVHRLVYRTLGKVERHVVDTVVHPLTVSATQRIEARSTRSDAYASEA